jgi:hypothetical protein
MRGTGRILVGFLVICLIGGAQACLALCAVPASTSSAKSSCGHCAGKSQIPAPKEEPCKHCHVISQENWGTPAHAFNFQLDCPSVPLLISSPATVPMDHAAASLPAMTHAPPGERLHHVCLLLI